MTVHRITHEILNNSDNNQNAPSDCVLLSILRKVQSSLQKAEIKNENVDCEVYKKPDVMKFIPQDTENLPRSNHDDLLNVQYLHLT